MPRFQPEAAVRRLLAEYERVSGPITPPVPVDKIAAEALDYFIEHTHDPRTKMQDAQKPANVVAALLSFEERKIWLRSGDHPHRQRFSLAHEIGHDQLHCRRHGGPKRAIFACGDEKIVETQSTDEKVEREANAFAAELLLPTHLLEPQVARLDASLALVLRLAADYKVSPVCMAIRIARAAWQPYAMIVSSNGVVDFSFCSGCMKEFSSYSFVEKGTPLDKEVETAQYFRHPEWISSERQSDHPVLASRWFSNCDEDRYLVEEVKGLGHGHVLTILTVDYDSPVEDAEESEEGDGDPLRFRFK